MNWGGERNQMGRGLGLGRKSSREGSFGTEQVGRSHIDDMQRLIHTRLRIKREPCINLRRDFARDDLENLAAELDKQAVEGGVDFVVKIFTLRLYVSPVLFTPKPAPLKPENHVSSDTDDEICALWGDDARSGFSHGPCHIPPQHR